MKTLIIIIKKESEFSSSLKRHRHLVLRRMCNSLLFNILRKVACIFLLMWMTGMIMAQGTDTSLRDYLRFGNSNNHVKIKT